MAEQPLMHPGSLLMVQERDRYLARVLRSFAGTSSAGGLRVFEAGCSAGYNLRLMVQWGADPADLAGMDLDPAAVAFCRSHAPEIRVHEGSATVIPEPDESFDVSLAFTLFSSVPDEHVAHGIGREMYRVTRPGGLLLVYDMRRRNPRNRAIHPIETADIRRWFPHCTIEARTMTLAPPISYRLGGRAPWLYGPLAAVPLLRTHVFWLLRRPSRP